MTKKFKAVNMAKLDNPERLEILPPHKVMALIELREGMTIADIGCGIGYFAIPMAKMVGTKGRIYALDLNPLMLEELAKRVEASGVDNVELCLTSENGFKLPKASVDMAFTSTVHHELDDAATFLKACSEILIPGGTMVIVDWNAVDESYGPPMHKRIPKEKVKQDLADAGFKIKAEHMLGKNFYVIVGEKWD